MTETAAVFPHVHISALKTKLKKNIILLIKEKNINLSRCIKPEACNELAVTKC